MFENSDSNSLKLIDMGLSQITRKNENFTNQKGSLFFVSPEMIMGKYNHKIDIWSAGVIFYLLITGKPAFWGQKYSSENGFVFNRESLIKMILKGEVNYDMSIFKKINPEVEKIIRGMLSFYPDKRPDAKDILQHPWFSCQKINILNQKGNILNNLNS